MHQRNASRALKVGKFSDSRSVQTFGIISRKSSLKRRLFVSSSLAGVGRATMTHQGICHDKSNFRLKTKCHQKPKFTVSQNVTWSQDIMMGNEVTPNSHVTISQKVKNVTTLKCDYAAPSERGTMRQNIPKSPSACQVKYDISQSNFFSFFCFPHRRSPRTRQRCSCALSCRCVTLGHRDSGLHHEAARSMLGRRI